MSTALLKSVRAWFYVDLGEVREVQIPQVMVVGGDPLDGGEVPLEAANKGFMESDLCGLCKSLVEAPEYRPPTSPTGDNVTGVNLERRLG